MEDLYRSNAKLSSNNPLYSDSFQQEFEESLTKLYSLALEFQARALCYLKKVWVAQVLRDMAKRDEWGGLQEDIEKSEESVKKFMYLIDASQTKKRLEEIQTLQEKDIQWRMTSAQDERVDKCLKKLDICPYRE